MDIFESRRKKFSLIKNIRRDTRLRVKSSDDAEEVFSTCPHCGGIAPQSVMTDNLMICPACGYHAKAGARERISMIADEGSFREYSARLTGNDPLRFPGYARELKNARRASGLNEAFIYGTLTICGSPAVAGVLDSRFIMGSMGTAVGEKVALAAELADKKKLPMIIFAASGGARMHEGTVSLMQMAKTCAAIRRFSDRGGLFISYLTDPTTGGVTASFASLGDIIIAEPGALIGFAGPRVIEQTIGKKLPEGFQRSEFLMEHGFIDMIVKRTDMRDTLSRLLKLHEGRRRDGRA